RHVEDHVAEEPRVERGEILCAIRQVHEHGADEVNDPEQPLGVEVLVGDEADDERRDDGAPGLGRVREADLRPGRTQVVREKAAHGDEPRAPDEKLDEHHHRQAYFCACHTSLPELKVRPVRSYRFTQAAPALLERTAASMNATPFSPSAPVGKTTAGSTGRPVRAAYSAAAISL